MENELLGKTLHPGTDYQAEKYEKKNCMTWIWWLLIISKLTGPIMVACQWNTVEGKEKQNLNTKLKEKKNFFFSQKFFFVATSNMHRSNMTKIYTSQGLAIRFILHFLVSTNLYMNNTNRCYELKCVSVRRFFFKL